MAKQTCSGNVLLATSSDINGLRNPTGQGAPEPTPPSVKPEIRSSSHRENRDSASEAAAALPVGRPKRNRCAKRNYKEESEGEWEADWEDDVILRVSMPFPGSNSEHSLEVENMCWEE